MLTSDKIRDSMRLETVSPARSVACCNRNRVKLGRLTGWIGLLFRRARIAPRPEQREHASLNLCFAQRLDLMTPVWLRSRGTSMLPWRIPGCEMKLERADPELGIGLIVVFRRGAKVYYHRVIKRVGKNRWQTKGDTLINSDEPVSGDDIIGRIVAVRRGSRVWGVQPDCSAAWLSEKLGHFFSRFGQPSGRLICFGMRVVYLAVLLSVWPFRHLLARQDSGGDFAEAAHTNERH